jgi:hypothetical protein
MALRRKESHSVARGGRQPPRDARQYPPATFRSRRRPAFRWVLLKRDVGGLIISMTQASVAALVGATTHDP